MEILNRLVTDLGQQRAAEALGVSQGMVNNVLKKRKRFSAERCVAIEARMAGTAYPITKAELRPDLFGPPPPVTEAQQKVAA
jgi:DNA-binding transcriptional regulator YdaS (Cro superfamily)